MREKSSDLTAEIISEELTFTLEELCGRCRLESHRIIEMVELGVLEPAGERPQNWQFSGSALYRVQATMRLSRELELNLPGAALVLDLLEESRALRAELEALKRHFFGSS